MKYFNFFRSALNHGLLFTWLEFKDSYDKFNFKIFGFNRLKVWTGSYLGIHFVLFSFCVLVLKTLIWFGWGNSLRNIYINNHVQIHIFYFFYNTLPIFNM